jgi:hypothetical protein
MTATDYIMLSFVICALFAIIACISEDNNWPH